MFLSISLTYQISCWWEQSSGSVCAEIQCSCIEQTHTKECTELNKSEFNGEHSHSWSWKVELLKYEGGYIWVGMSDSVELPKQCSCIEQTHTNECTKVNKSEFIGEHSHSWPWKVELPKYVGGYVGLKK